MLLHDYTADEWDPKYSGDYRIVDTFLAITSN